jgi:hypothetical protein
MACRQSPARSGSGPPWTPGHQAFDHPNEIAEAITRLVVADGLVGTDRAHRLIEVTVGPRTGDVRRIIVEWEDPRVYTNVEPERRRLEGEWRRP